jgi:hypothetical protein
MHHSLVLDGGVLVNLYVSREGPAILRSAAVHSLTTAAILREKAPSLDEPGELVTLAEVLSDWELSTPEIKVDGFEARLLDWVFEVPGPLAYLLMLAEHVGAAVATDDARIRAAVQSLSSDLALTSTQELLYSWRNSAQPSDLRVRAAVAAIAQDAYYLPSGDDTPSLWWQDIVRPQARTSEET